MKLHHCVLAVALGSSVLVSSACGGGADDTLEPKGPGSANGVDLSVPEGTTIGPAGVRPLTAREWETSVRDAFGLGAEWKGAPMSPDRASELGFDNDGTLLEIDENRAAELSGGAESAAEAILAAQKLGDVPGCKEPSRACVDGVVATRMPRLFRHAVSNDEKMRYVELFEAVAKQSNAREGLKWTLSAMLASPSFVYRHELGIPAPGDRVTLTGEEVATELAYAFTGTLPSDELLEKGRRGELFAADARRAAARSLLETPRGHDLVADFGRQWLRYTDTANIAKDESIVPGFGALRQDMVDETRRFLDFVLFTKKGGTRELLSSPETFVTPALATHYGIEPSGAAPTTRPQAIGILSHASILSRYGLAQSSSPPQRGAFVRRKLLCQSLPHPPPNAGQPPVPQPGFTTRELYEKVHATQPACAGCHQLLDLVGFGLERFDLVGRYRTEERGKPVDPSGRIANFADGESVTFADETALAKLLAESPKVADCVGAMTAAYTFGATNGKTFAVEVDRAGFRSGKIGLLDYMAALASSPHMVLRSSK